MNYKGGFQKLAIPVREKKKEHERGEKDLAEKAEPVKTAVSFSGR